MKSRTVSGQRLRPKIPEVVQDIIRYAWLISEKISFRRLRQSPKKKEKKKILATLGMSCCGYGPPWRHHSRDSGRNHGWDSRHSRDARAMPQMWRPDPCRQVLVWRKIDAEKWNGPVDGLVRMPEIPSIPNAKEKQEKDAWDVELANGFSLHRKRDNGGFLKTRVESTASRY